MHFAVAVDQHGCVLTDEQRGVGKALDFGHCLTRYVDVSACNEALVNAMRGRVVWRRSGVRRMRAFERDSGDGGCVEPQFTFDAGEMRFKVPS